MADGPQMSREICGLGSPGQVRVQVVGRRGTSAAYQPHTLDPCTIGGSWRYLAQIAAPTREARHDRPQAPTGTHRRPQAHAAHSQQWSTAAQQPPGPPCTSTRTEHTRAVRVVGREKMGAQPIAALTDWPARGGWAADVRNVRCPLIEETEREGAKGPDGGTRCVCMSLSQTSRRPFDSSPPRHPS